jgi:outer membrane lipoprotein-sorting protein
MKLFPRILALCLLLTTAGWTQKDPPTLESVLKQLDATAANFHSAEASFVWDQFTRVVNETDTQKGKIYFRRHDHEIQMAADITEPDKKYVLYTNGKVQLYQPKIDQVTEYNAGKKRADIDSFLVLGFGGGGHELLKSYSVQFAGTEKIGVVQTAKLELTPKSQSVLNNIAKIILWINPDNGISVQQQFFQPSGDYRLAKYSDIQMNQKIPDDVFKLKTTSKTKVVSPQG